MPKPHDLLAEAQALLERGRELVADWEARWPRFEPLTRDELLKHYAVTANAVTEVVDQIKAVRETLTAANGREGGEADADLLDVLKKLVVIRARAQGGIRHMTTPFVPSDPERYERGLREAAEGRGIPIEEVIRYFRDRKR